MIESRQISAALDRIEKFDPKDADLTFLLFVGARYVVNMHVISPTAG
jgi:hypothetical protein